MKLEKLQVKGLNNAQLNQIVGGTNGGDGHVDIQDLADLLTGW